MFNKNFYPTPQKLVDKMLECIDLSKIKTLLEPSAGKGDIINIISKKCNSWKVNVE